MSALTYNGVQVGYVFSEQYEHAPDPDPTGVDSMWTRTSIRVRGVIAPGVVPALNGETPYQTANRIAAALSVPRRRLVYVQGTTTAIDTDALPDAENGPWPTAYSVDPGPAEGGFVVHFGVTLKQLRCTGAAARGFVSLKWQDSESFDLKGNKTRRRTGTLIVSRQFTGNADEKRNLVIPLVPAGFRRESSDYTLSEDGLKLRFVFVDKQLHKGVPGPAVKVSGTMAEITGKNGVGPRRGELQLRLEGRPGTPARDLLNAAIGMGMARVYASNPFQNSKGPAGTLISGGVREVLDDDQTAVELSLSWQIKPSTARLTGKQASQLSGGGLGVLGTFAAGAYAASGVGVATGALGGVLSNAVKGGGTIDARTPENRPAAGLPGLAPWLGQPMPGADLAAGVPTTTRGTGLATAVRPLAAFLFDPCGMEAELSSRNSDSSWVGTTADGSTLTARVGTVLPDDDEGVAADDELPGTWDVWDMSYTLAGPTGYMVIPSTVPGEPGSKVRWGNAEAVMVVKWNLKRTGGVPPLPDAVIPKVGGYTGDGTSDDNWVLETRSMTLNNVELAGDGVSFVYEAAGECEFRALDPSKAGIAYPVPPWLIPNDRPTAGSIPQGKAAGPSNPFGPYPGQYPNVFGGPLPLP